MWPYLTSATILREIEKLCVGKAQNSIWKFRFILALLLRRSHGPMPSLKDDRAQKSYAEKIIATCHSRSEFLHRLTDAEKRIASAIRAEGSQFDTRNAQQDRRFVERLLAATR